jgi:hypothetical protein
MSPATSRHDTGMELSVARNGAADGRVSTARNVMMVDEVDEVKV